MENQQENQGVSATPVPVPGGSTPVAAQGGTNLQIQNVYSLSDPFYSTPSKPTARKKTGGKTPSRIKPKLVSRQVTFKKPMEDYEDSQSIEFLRTYIPNLMYQYLQVYGREPQKAKEISHLLQAAQRTFNQIVAWKGPPVIIDENVNEEDLNVHVAFVSEMRKNLQLLRYFTPWLVEKEDVMSCMEHIQTLEDLIPKFESVTSLPKTESVQQVNNVKGWVLSLMTGCIELKNPRKESVTPSGDKGTPKPTPIQPPAPASLQDLQKYIPQVFEQMHDLRRKATLTVEEKNLQKACKTNLNSALDDLNNILRWRQTPSQRQKNSASGTVKEVVQKITAANKLREAQMVYQILEPLVVEKMLWENMRRHNRDLQSFCKEFEKAEPPSKLLWETAEEHIKWYKFVIGNYIHLCKEGEVMSHKEKEDPAANLDVDTGGGNIAPSGTATQSGIPGGAV